MTFRPWDIVCVELLANGWSEQQIIENYPGIVREDVSACLRYAADVLKSGSSG